METLFTICALVGGGLLVLSLLGTHDGVPHDGLSGAAFHAGHGGDGGDHPGWGLHGWFWLSLRSLISFAAFFGLGGLLASWLGLRPALQLGSALLAGLAVGGFTAFIFRLARLRGELAGRTASLVGRTARVLVSPRGSIPGKVVLKAAGQSEQLLACSSDPLAPGDQVLVIAEAGGLLDVKRWDGQ